MTDSLASSFEFHRQDLDCVVGGLSALDIHRLNIQTHDEARQFCLAYGYDINDSEHREQLWAIHRRAVSLIKEQLLDAGEILPERLIDPAQLTDLSELLIIASSSHSEDREMQRWACAILRVMHVYVHLRNDLFSAFRDEIQAQILKPLQEAILQDDLMGSTVLGPSQFDGGVRLHKFEIKPFKTTASSVIKLLARPERVALTLLDKLGVRFVTRNVYDAFRVIRYLIENHLVSFPHIMPDQSNNTLYPVNLFIETMNELKVREQKGETFSTEQVEEVLKGKLALNATRAEYRTRLNEFSDPDYRFIKLINRKLVTVSLGEDETKRAFRFFYPFEIQIMDYDTYVRNLSGPMAHDEYKSRQRRRARERVFGPESS
jgi:uncharacterized protein (TIGR04562 family)